MSKLMRKISLLLVFIAFFISFLIYLIVYKNNPINNYFSNFTATFFKLEKLKLDGRERTSKERILSSLAIEINSSILNINLKELKKNILTVPWVKSAKVSRKLPNEIHEEEYTPKLFSEDQSYESDEINRDLNEKTTQEPDQLFDQDVNEEDDFEIPAFLRKQKF